MRKVTKPNTTKPSNSIRNDYEKEKKGRGERERERKKNNVIKGGTK